MKYRFCKLVLAYFMVSAPLITVGKLLQTITMMKIIMDMIVKRTMTMADSREME